MPLSNNSNRTFFMLLVTKFFLVACGGGGSSTNSETDTEYRLYSNDYFTENHTESYKLSYASDKEEIEGTLNIEITTDEYLGEEVWAAKNEIFVEFLKSHRFVAPAESEFAVTYFYTKSEADRRLLAIGTQDFDGAYTLLHGDNTPVLPLSTTSDISTFDDLYIGTYAETTDIDRAEVELSFSIASGQRSYSTKYLSEEYLFGSAGKYPGEPQLILNRWFYSNPEGRHLGMHLIVELMEEKADGTGTRTMGSFALYGDRE